MTTLTTGGHLVFTERFDPFAWGEVLRVESVTLTSVVPTLLQPLLQIGVRAEKVPTLRALLVSSAPLTAEPGARLRRKDQAPSAPGLGAVRVHELRLLPVRPIWPRRNDGSCSTAAS